MKLDMTVVDLKRNLVDAMDMMSPEELAGRIIEAIDDTEYRARVIDVLRMEIDVRKSLPF